jgi:hypothetical protein
MREKLLARALEKVLRNYQDDKEKLEKEEEDNKAASEILELLEEDFIHQYQLESLTLNQLKTLFRFLVPTDMQKPFQKGSKKGQYVHFLKPYVVEYFAQIADASLSQQPSISQDHVQVQTEPETKAQHDQLSRQIIRDVEQAGKKRRNN